MDKRIPTFALVITMILTLVAILFEVPPTYAHIIRVGGRINLEIELLPPERLFHPDEDGYFYPGSPRITKNLKVVNVGDIPFRISQLSVILHDDKQLANGLMTEIEQVGRTENYCFYVGTLANLQDGVSVPSDRAIPRGKTVTLRVTVWMPKTAGNEYQGLHMTADLTITVCFPPKSLA